MFPITVLGTIPIPQGGIELLLVEAVQVPAYYATSAATGNILISVPDGAVVKKLVQEDTNTSVGTALSMHLQSTNADYQTPSTGTTKIILVVGSTGVGSNNEFKVHGHTSADAVGGTTHYDFSNTTALDASQFQTTDIMTGFGTSEFVNVELEATTGGGGIILVEGWAIEIPA